MLSYVCNIQAGISAPTEFLNRLTYMSVNHSKKLVAVDTVRAYHFGNQVRSPHKFFFTPISHVNIINTSTFS